MTKNDKIVKWINWAIRSFDNDTPDSSYQCGYLAALLDAVQQGPHYLTQSQLKKKMSKRKAA